MVINIEAKRIAIDRWEAYTDNGRERTGKDVVSWAKEAVSFGAGEILLTSVDQEGTRKGFDVALIEAVSSVVSVPVIASGGFGKMCDLSLATNAGASAVAIADAIHWKRMGICDIKRDAALSGLDMRFDVEHKK